MVMMLAYEAAQSKQFRNRGDAQRGTTRGNIHVPFFGHTTLADATASADAPTCWAALTQWDPGRASGAHFHTCDQFQVIVAGRGKLGRHDLIPYGVHFSRAYTPYGPLVADREIGLSFFVLRVQHDPGSQRLPEQREQLRQVANRRPWQITRAVSFTGAFEGTAPVDSELHAVPGIHDEQGLAAFTLSVKPNAQVCAPDPVHGAGQYLIVTKGSLLHANTEYQTWALVFVEPQDGPFPIRAGAHGLQALVLNFPRLTGYPHV